MRNVALCVALAACTGNSSGQSFHDGVQALCDTPAHVPDSGEPYDKRLAAVARWADQNVTNAEARQLGGDLNDLAKNREALAAAVTKAGIAHCTLLDNGMELQSFADAMKVICEASDPSPAYYKSHLLNAEVVRLFAALGDANPADARRIFDDAVKRAGRTSCPSFTAAMDKRTIAAPTVADLGLVELDTAVSSLVITKTGIVVEGRAIVAVADGDVDPAEKEGGALGIMVPRLRDFTKALVAEQAKRPGASPEPVLAVIADPSTPYRLLLASLFSTKTAGIRRFLLGVNTGATTKAIPLVLPDAKAAPRGLGLVVSLTRDHLQLWSISGQEGSLKQPKLEVPSDRLADVQKALAEIVARRWKGKPRPDVEREVLVQPAGDIPLQALASLLVAVRTNTDGSELFPEVRLGSGFE